MGTLSLLHGAAGTLVLCVLVFAEETGIPLPLVPGDVVLVGGGLLIADGNVNPWIYLPLVVAAAVLGALTGYAWSRLFGAKAIGALATKLHATRQLDRAGRTLKSAGPRGIVIGRFIPGTRVLTTLLAGALHMRVRAVLTGVVPAVMVWVACMTTLGVFAGPSVATFLTEVDRCAVAAALAACLGIGVYLGGRAVARHADRMPPQYGLVAC